MSDTNLTDAIELVKRQFTSGNDTPVERASVRYSDIEPILAAASNSSPLFSGLSPAQIERLAVLVEEMGESQQAIGKILRHGYESRHPDGGPTNRESLELELGDVENSMDMLRTASDVGPQEVLAARIRKSNRISPFLHHQDANESGDQGRPGISLSSSLDIIERAGFSMEKRYLVEDMITLDYLSPPKSVPEAIIEISQKGRRQGIRIFVDANQDNLAQNQAISDLLDLGWLHDEVRLLMQNIEDRRACKD